MMTPWQESKAIDSLVTGKCGVRVAHENCKKPIRVSQKAMTEIGCNANKTVISNANKSSRYAAIANKSVNSNVNKSER